MSPGKCAAAAVSLCSALWGCGANDEPPATLTTVSPAMAYNNAATALLLKGGPFRPAYRFDTMAAATKTEVGDFSATLLPATATAGDGAGAIQLDAVSWQSVGALAAVLPAGVPAGNYDVAVTDPRGRRVTGPAATFTSLGPDGQAPELTIVSPAPGTIIGAQTTITIALMADDGDGLLKSMSGKVSALDVASMPPCAIPPATRQTVCYFDFTAPAPSGDGDMVIVEASALDAADNPASAYATFWLAPRPSLTRVSPTVGPAGGGTAIAVYGADFVADRGAENTKLLLDGREIAAEVVDATTVMATTPEHDPGTGMLTVSTGGAASKPLPFTFIATPTVKMVSPTRGATAGGTRIAIVGNHFRTLTEVSIGGTALVCPCLISATRIEGVIPPGSAGPVAITVSDPGGGSTALSNAFTYDPVVGADPPNCDCAR